MTAVPLQDSRIQIRRQTSHRDDGAANVIMQLSWQGVGYGGSYRLLADVRRRVRKHVALI